MRSGNPWMEAFDWVRENTPKDAYFAINPWYLQQDGVDFHSFRALAERSHLADAWKDAAVVTQVPELGPEWERQSDALKGWDGFGIEDFRRLNREFGVDWLLVDHRPPEGLDCVWTNGRLTACRIPR